MSRRLRSLYLVALLVALAVPAPIRAQSVSTTVRIGVIGYSDAASEPLYAQGSDLFARYSLDAKITPFNSGAAIIAAVAGGSLDIGFSNIVSAVSAIEHGIPVVALTPAAIFSDKVRADILLVKARGSKLKTGADLNGKTVAVTTVGGTTQLCAQAWVDKNGGDSKTVRFVEVPTSAMAAALRAGRIDAAMLAEPNLSQGKADVEELGPACLAIAPQWTNALFVASKAWVEANPAAARRFVEAMVETARWSNNHHAETAKILAPLSGIDPATFDVMARSVYGDSLRVSMLQPVIDVAVKYGTLKEPLNASQLVSDAQPYWRGVK
jgi:NitT/TauT family transport system substrate-binding protein